MSQRDEDIGVVDALVASASSARGSEAWTRLRGALRERNRPSQTNMLAMSDAAQAAVTARDAAQRSVDALERIIVPPGMRDQPSEIPPPPKKF